MSRRYDTRPWTDFPRVGETWFVKKRGGGDVRLTLGVRKGRREWFYPRTNEVYEDQDLVGLVRRTTA